MKNWERYSNWAVKGLLVVLLLTGLLFPDQPQFVGKGWPLRVAFYPLSAIIIPIIWLITKPTRKYPHIADMFLVIPFLGDTVGNVANLFDTVQNTDDVLHFINWMFLVAALVVMLAPLRLASWNLILLGAGSGAFAIVIWEIVEYLIAESGTTGLHLTYVDTIGDLALSTTGGAVGAIAVVLLSSKRELRGRPGR